MLLTLEKMASHDAITHLEGLLDLRGIAHQMVVHPQKTSMILDAPLADEDLEKLAQTGVIERISRPKVPYKLASKEASPERTRIVIGDVVIGGEELVLMAGPCAIESEEQLVEVATQLKESGVNVLRASAYKPRSSPYSFQGLGLEGLKMHKRAREKHGLLIETEVLDARDVQVAAEYVDILRVGARNMQNFALLKEMGKCGKPVILKRGMSATIEEWLLSAEYIMAHGNPDVILCERGIRTFCEKTRSTLDLSSVAVARELTHLPIIVDPSHAAGRADIIPALSSAAVAVGADGLLVEVHPNPKESLCDARQALSPKEFKALAKEALRIKAAMREEE